MGVLAAAVVLAACGGGEASQTSATLSTTTLEPAGVAGDDLGATDASADAVAPALAGTNWNVTLYLDNGAMTQLWPGTEITLSFGEDGTISGSGGCNGYTGTFDVRGPYDPFEDGIRDENDGQAIAIEVTSVTEKACTSPGGIMDQESEYLNALETSARWLIARGNLLLRTGGGFFLIEAETNG
jgi:heat shock protein HslJ